MNQVRNVGFILLFAAFLAGCSNGPSPGRGGGGGEGPKQDALADSTNTSSSGNTELQFMDFDQKIPIHVEGASSGAPLDGIDINGATDGNCVFVAASDVTENTGPGVFTGMASNLSQSCGLVPAAARVQSVDTGYYTRSTVQFSLAQSPMENSLKAIDATDTKRTLDEALSLLLAINEDSRLNSGFVVTKSTNDTLDALQDHLYSNKVLLEFRDATESGFKQWFIEFASSNSVLEHQLASQLKLALDHRGLTLNENDKFTITGIPLSRPFFGFPDIIQVVRTKAAIVAQQCEDKTFSINHSMVTIKLTRPICLTVGDLFDVTTTVVANQPAKLAALGVSLSGNLSVVSGIPIDFPMAFAGGLKQGRSLVHKITLRANSDGQATISPVVRFLPEFGSSQVFRFDGTGYPAHAPQTPPLQVDGIHDILFTLDEIGNPNEILDDEEITMAFELWINNETVPDTDQTISDEAILALMWYWISGFEFE